MLPTPRGRVAVALAVAPLLCLPALAACAGRPGAARSPSAASGPALAGNLQIVADSSLQPGFDPLIAAFGARHPGLRIGPPTYEGSHTLATALLRGGSADVVALADPATMNQLEGAGKVVTGTARSFARDPLAIMVKAGNPQAIATLGDLAQRGVAVVLPDPSLPTGAAVAQVLSRAGLRLPSASTRLKPSELVAAVGGGSADASILLRSDVAAGGSAVSAVAIPADGNAPATDSIGVVPGGPDGTAAQAFVDFVASGPGQAVLQRAGFDPAPPG